jgi:hypothetical protein
LTVPWVEGHEAHEGQITDASVDQFYCAACGLWIPKNPDERPTLKIEAAPTADGDGSVGVEAGLRVEWGR